MIINIVHKYILSIYKIIIKSQKNIVLNNFSILVPVKILPSSSRQSGLEFFDFYCTASTNHVCIGIIFPEDYKYFMSYLITYRRVRRMMKTTLSLRAAVTTDPRRRRDAGQTTRITMMERGAGRKRGQSYIPSTIGFTTRL